MAKMVLFEKVMAKSTKCCNYIW